MSRRRESHISNRRLCGHLYGPAQTFTTSYERYPVLRTGLTCSASTLPISYPSILACRSSAVIR